MCLPTWFSCRIVTSTLHMNFIFSAGSSRKTSLLPFYILTIACCLFNRYSNHTWPCPALLSSLTFTRTVLPLSFSSLTSLGVVEYTKANTFIQIKGYSFSCRARCRDVSFAVYSLRGWNVPVCNVFSFIGGGRCHSLITSCYFWRKPKARLLKMNSSATEFTDNYRQIIDLLLFHSQFAWHPSFNLTLHFQTKDRTLRLADNANGSRGTLHPCSPDLDVGQQWPEKGSSVTFSLRKLNLYFLNDL